MRGARRLRELPPYPFALWNAEVEATRRQGLDVIRLDIGNPDLPPPEEAVNALCRSARLPSSHGYTGYRGLAELREAIAGYYLRRFGVELDPACEVLPLIGSKEGIVNLSLALLNPGDIALIPDPSYASYRLGATLAGARVRTLPLVRSNRFLPDLSAVRPADVSQASLLWLNYPNNPTGAVSGVEHFGSAVSFARAHGLLLCHDAAYADVGLNGYIAPSLLQVPGAIELAVEVNSLSKTCNMAGWRVGMAVGNRHVLSALAQVKSNFDSGLPRPVQEAAIAALSVDREWIVERNAAYSERARTICHGLTAAGIEAEQPQASLYVWARLPDWFATGVAAASEDFARRLLTGTGVAVAPGSFFGAEGEGYLRVSMTSPAECIQEAMSRLGAFAQSVHKLGWRRSRIRGAARRPRL